MKEKSTPVWLAEQQAAACMSDEALAHSMGYDSPAIVQMMKAGSMKVPLNKAPELAAALEIDPGTLMRRLLHDLSPELLAAIEHCLGPLGLSAGEQKLIAAIRKANPVKEPVPIMFDRDAIITLVVA